MDTVIKSLSRSTKYEVIVQAYNGKGAGPSSDVVTAVTYQEGECLSHILFVYSAPTLRLNLSNYCGN